jgi:hypothetical protein
MGIRFALIVPGWYMSGMLYGQGVADLEENRPFVNNGATVNAQAGFTIRNGESISTKIIAIVPKGERPKVNCRTVFLPE